MSLLHDLHIYFLRALLLREIVINATPSTMTAEAAMILELIVSLRINQPKKTATIGLMYEYVEINVGA